MLLCCHAARTCCCGVGTKPTRMFCLLQSCEAAIAIDGDFYEAQKERIRALIATEAFEAAVNEARNLVQQHQNDGDMHHVSAPAAAIGHCG